MKWLYIIVLSVCIVCILFLTADCKSSLRRTGHGRQPRDLEAILYIPQKVWKRNSRLELDIALLNVSNKPVVIDQRLNLGTSLVLKFKYANSKKTCFETKGRITKPASADLLILLPGRFFGRRFGVVPLKKQQCENICPELRNLKPGKIMVQIEYRATDYAWNWQYGKPPWWTGVLTSEWQELLIK